MGTPNKAGVRKIIEGYEKRMEVLKKDFNTMESKLYEATEELNEIGELLEDVGYEWDSDLWRKLHSYTNWMPSTYTC